MQFKLTIKQILRKKFFNIKKDLLLKNRDKANNYHSQLRQNADRLASELIQSQKVIVKNKQLLIGTYLPVPEREIVPPCFSAAFFKKFGIKPRYFTPSFTTKSRQMRFIEHQQNQPKSSQFYLTSFGVKAPKIALNNNNFIDQPALHILLVPLICIEHNTLQRIGYGGGYYDEYINSTKLKSTISVGVALEGLMFDQNQLAENQQHSNIWTSWDQPLNYTITEKKIIKSNQ